MELEITIRVLGDDYAPIAVSTAKIQADNIDPETVKVVGEFTAESVAKKIEFAAKSAAASAR